MNNLIELKQTKGKATVSARELHQKLDVKAKFADWIKRMIEYGFEENKDYTVLKNEKGDNGQFASTEYFISIDMAKEICMIQRSEIGKKFRRYFIACENKLFEQKEIRDKSKKVRNNFTNTLANHGYTKQYEYIQTTNQMKKSLGIKNKKKDMTERELKLVTAAEYLADCLIDEQFGYQEVNPVCIEASENVNNLIETRKNKQIA